MKNLEVYKKGKGKEIMSSGNYCSNINRYLIHEQNFLRDILKHEGNDLLIEFGCSDYRLKKILILYGIEIEYLGVDINKANVPPPDDLSRLINVDANKIVKKDMSRFLEKYKNPLIILPFNFVGNMDSPINFLSLLFKLKLNIIISQFSINNIATAIRLNYYACCGFSSPRVKKEGDSVTISFDEKYETTSICPEKIISIAREQDYECVFLEGNNIFNILYVKH